MSSAPRTTLFVDVESCSPLDLREVGAYRYWAHPETRVICLCWAEARGPVQTWFPDDGAPPPALTSLLTQAEIVAHNAVFERLALRTLPLPWLKIRDFVCTQAQAAYYGLPLSLEKAALALALPVQKDMAGSALMKRMARPRKTLLDGSHIWWDRAEPERRARLAEYCAQDVLTTRTLHFTLPRLPRQEEVVYWLDQEINDRGVRIDRPLVQKLLTLAKQALACLDEDMRFLTNGAVPACSNVKALTQWVRDQGVPMRSLDKQAVIDLLAAGQAPERVRDALVLRQEAGKTSTAKLQVLLDASVPGTDRIHGTLQYYGANRTGRWAGRLIQTHNLPRPAIKHPEKAADRVLAGLDLEGLELFFKPPPLVVLSSLIRACLVPTPGHVFVVCDFAGIEARVVAWLAGQQDTLDVFASGQDIYTYTAKKIGSDSRALGKALVLGCGYGLGAAKFLDTAHQWGATVTAEQAEAAVAAWRDANRSIVLFWYSLDRAARQVINTRGPATASCSSRHVSVSREWVNKHPLLVVTLPSGRQLFYWNPRVTADDQIEVDGPNPITKIWGPIRTYGGKLVENVTQAVARDLLVRAMWVLAQAGWKIVLHVHDEIVLEVPEHDAETAKAAVLAAMSSPPAWAKGLPLDAEAGILARYGKP